MLKKKEIKRGEKTEEETGRAQEVLGWFGLDGLVKAMGKSPAFEQKFKEVNKEIEERLKERSSKKDYPIKTESNFSIRPIMGTSKPIKRHFVEAEPKVEKIELNKEGLKKKDSLVDIFEEKNELRVIIELQDVNEKDIKINLKGKILSIEAKKQKKKIKLPCLVKGKAEKKFKNNILEIKLKKAKEKRRKRKKEEKNG